MIKIENAEVFGFDAALRGMRNPMNSWDRSDSGLCTDVPPSECRKSEYCQDGQFCIGLEDIKLMKKLYKAGPEHRKYLRMIHVQMDITAPLYWWKEFDTYKIGTVTNSCSTMHKLTAKPFELSDFSTEHLNREGLIWMENTCIFLNQWRSAYIVKPDKDTWWQMIQLLPSSYNQRRTVDFNYEVANNILHQRRGHKLDEWNRFCDNILMLPWFAEVING